MPEARREKARRREGAPEKRARRPRHGRPWVTCALVLALVASFVGVRSGARDARAEAEARMAEAVANFERNPFVEVPPRFERSVGADRIAGLRAAHTEERRERGLPYLSEHLRDRAQRHFDALLEEADAAADALPAHRFGITGSALRARNLFTHAFVHDTPQALGLTLLFLVLAGVALEATWGSLVFALFCAAAALVSALAYAAFHPEPSEPWIGFAGVVTALVGAYLVRSWRGDLVLSGWLLAPAWLAADAFLVRGLHLGRIAEVPFATHGAALGLGVAGAVVLRLLDVDRTRAVREEEEGGELVSKPELERALALRAAGRNEDAWKRLLEAHRASPGDRDVVVALWDLARELSREEEATPALIGLVQSQLRKRQGGEAVLHWLELRVRVPEAEIPPQLLVRIGEALLDEGHPGEALAAMRRAVELGPALAAALALRVVRVARDLDPDLARRAARLALRDPPPDPEECARLRELAAGPAPAAPRQEPSSSERERTERPSVAPEAREAAPWPAPREEELGDLDPLALDADRLSDDVGAGPEEAGAPERWNDPGLLADLGAEADRSEVATSPLELRVLPSSGGNEDVTDVIEDDLEAIDSRDATEKAPAPRESMAAADTADAGRRPLKLLVAVPLSLDGGGLRVEVDGKGKSRIPFDRVDAFAVAAVEGLSRRSVLVADLILNWGAGSREPLKVVRLRSDRFDPRRLAPGGSSPLEAFRWLSERILDESGATPLPDPAAARGSPFARYAALAEYEREVLLVQPSR